jgi:hypothetical protein
MIDYNENNTLTIRNKIPLVKWCPLVIYQSAEKSSFMKVVSLCFSKASSSSGVFFRGDYRP